MGRGFIRVAGLVAAVLAGAAILAASAAATRLPVATQLTAQRVASSTRGAPHAPARSPGVPPRGTLPGLVAAKQRANSRAGVRASASPTPRTAVFGGLNQPGLAADGTASPGDPTGAMGPSHYVQLVNSSIGVFSRSGLGLVSSEGLDAFAANSGDVVFDVQVIYDSASARFFYVALDVDPAGNDLMLSGFSKSSDPSNLATGWCHYSVNTDQLNGSTPGALIADFPKLGQSAGWLSIGANAFDASGNFLTALVFTTDKPAAGSLTTCPAPGTFSVFGSVASPLQTASAQPAFTPVAVNHTDGPSDGYVVAADAPPSGSGNQLSLWRVDSSGTLNTPSGVTVSPYAVPANVPQPGSGSVLDSLDGSLTQAVGRTDPDTGSQAIWTQHTIDGVGGNSVVRWYELVPSSGTVLRQQADQVGAGSFLFNAAISPTSAGNAAVLTYNTGSASQVVSMRVQSRRAGDPLGSMHSELDLGSSQAVDQDFTCPVCRWGDYAGASPDPSDNGLVWVTNMLNGPARAAQMSQWTTRIAAISPANSPPVAGLLVAPSPATAGQPVGFSPLGSFDPDGSLASFNWNFGDGAGSNSVFPVHVYATAGSYPITLTVTDADGTSAQSTQALQVNPAPTPPTPPPPTPTPKAPVISSARLSPTSFLAASTGGSLTRTRPTGTNISYRDSQSATTTFAVLRPTTGHRSGRRCLVGRPRRGQRRCTVLVTKGSFSHRDRAGNVRVHFTGRVRGRKLSPGSYALTLTPKANGKTGRTARLSFRVHT